MGRASRRKAERREADAPVAPVAPLRFPTGRPGTTGRELDRLATLIAAAQQPSTVDLERLQLVRQLRPQLERVEAAAWREARTAGYSWRELGDALQMGKSGAQMRARQLLGADESRPRRPG